MPRNLRKKYQELLSSMPANIYPVIHPDMVSFVDVSDECAPLITFEFHNEYAKLSQDEKMQMVIDMIMGANNAGWEEGKETIPLETPDLEPLKKWED